MAMLPTALLLLLGFAAPVGFVAWTSLMPPRTFALDGAPTLANYVTTVHRRLLAPARLVARLRAATTTIALRADRMADRQGAGGRPRPLREHRVGADRGADLRRRERAPVRRLSVSDAARRHPGRHSAGAVRLACRQLPQHAARHPGRARLHPPALRAVPDGAGPVAGAARRRSRRRAISAPLAGRS